MARNGVAWATRRPQAGQRLGRKTTAAPPTYRPLRTPSSLNAESVLELQRRAGNGAVTRLLKGSDHAGPVVQRHSSWEHALIGDTSPRELGQAVGTGDENAENRNHLLAEELRRMQFFHLDPTRDPTVTGDFPGIRWIQLKKSKLWLSYGELTALPDYLSSATYADYMDAETLIPVVQRLRQAIQDKIEEHLPRQEGGGIYEELMKRAEGYQHGQADEEGVSGKFSGAVAEVNAVDNATAWLGPERYKGVLSRNACHFAPYSWERWRHFHNEARRLALEYHKSDPWSNTASVRENQSAAVDGPGREAVLNNGFGDHYLQDSFAAGHLANKTLMMQWFVEYVGKHAGDIEMLSKLLPTSAEGQGVLDAIPQEVLEVIPGQSGAVGRGLYGRDATETRSVSDDRYHRSDVTDPQSAEERESRTDRIGGSGVVAGSGRGQGENYQVYLEFLNNAVVNYAAGQVHDWLNDHGLTVKNQSGSYEADIGGDGTMLALSDARGAEVVSQASHDSADAIDELMRTGNTGHSPEAIFGLVPVTVVVKYLSFRRELSLEQYQDVVLHSLCDESIFPDLIHSYTAAIIAHVDPELVKGGASQDSDGR